MGSERKQVAVPISAVRGIKVSNFRPCQKNTLLGFVTLTLPSSLVIRDCTIHRKNDSRWIGLPAREYTKPDGTKAWSPVLEFADSDAKKRFQWMALQALEQAGIEGLF